MIEFSVIYGAWLVWLATWVVAARWSQRTVKRPAVRQEIVYRVVTLAGAVLLFERLFHRWDVPLWQLTTWVAWLFVGFVLIGLLFTWWARLTLGTLWSSTVTRKVGHQVVDTGPYAIVRHPIYTGVSFAALATAAERGTLLGWLGAALIVIGFYVKARLEETFLAQELGRETYEAYARRVPMLVPGRPARD